MAISYAKQPKPTFVQAWSKVIEAEPAKPLKRVVTTEPKTEVRRLGRPPSGKVRVTMLLDPDIVAKFKATGAGWQARMNNVLKAAKL